jgi:hypothetical protein
MKRLLVLALVLSSLVGSTQTIVNRAGPANTVSDARLQAQYNFFAPRYADTTAANVQIGADSCGAVIYTYSNNSFWYRQCSPKRWNQYITNNYPDFVVIDSANWATNGSWTSPFPDSTLPCTGCQTNFWLGIKSGRSITTGGLNTAVGYASQEQLASQFHNTSLGAFTLRQNIQFGNTAIGTAVLNKSTNLQASTGVGAFTMYKVNTMGTNGGTFFRAITSMGYGSMSGTNNNGEYNTAFGAWAGSALNGGHNNVIIGPLAAGAGGLGSPLGGTANFTGALNVLIGSAAGYAMTTGSSNVTAGANSGRLLTTGSHNILLGDSSGFDITTGSNNVILGSYYGTDFATAGYHFLAGNADVKWLHGDSTGAVGVGVGTTNPLTTSILELKSTTRGFLPPRMTAAQRLAISSPAIGLVVYDTDSSRLFAYQGAWKGIKWTDEGGGSSTSPAGNFGNLQINRNGVFSSPASDSLDFESATGLTVKGGLRSTTLGINTASPTATYAAEIKSDGTFSTNLLLSNAATPTSFLTMNSTYGDVLKFGSLFKGVEAIIGLSDGLFRISVGANHLMSFDATMGAYTERRFQVHQATGTGSANNLVLPSDGNVIEITGTTQVNLISNSNWQDGAEVTLMFTGSLTVKNGQATSGANITILLAGASDFSATADDVLKLVIGTVGGVRAWREVSRSVN